MYRRTWMEINLDQIAENVRKIGDICHKKVIAVLKADAYGCGDIQVCRACEEAGAQMVAVSSLDEAMILRNEGYTGKLLILGMSDPDDVEDLKKADAATAAYSSAWVDEVLKHDARGLKVHLAVDTGMNRIGFKDLDEMRAALQKMLDAGVIVEGIFTHFYCSDIPDHVITDRQFAAFDEAVKAMHYPFEWIHCDNSDATLFHHDPLSNACRVGITLYGISPYRNDFAHPISLYSAVYMCKHVPAGETIGYGATYTTTGDEIIGTAPIGYADGLIRANQVRKVYVDGQYGTIVGRVCMDQVMIRLDHEVPMGTKVEIFGPHISLEEMAADLHTIPYEVICLISGRVTRRYIWHGQLMQEQNDRLIRSEA